MNPISISVLDQNGVSLFSANLDYIAGASLQTYLETLVNTSAPGTFSFGIQYYGSFQNSALGYLVTMIKGIYDAPGSGTYWSISYNKTQALAGVDGLYPGPGATIVFQQATYNVAIHSATPLAAKQSFHYEEAKKKAPGAGKP